MRYRKEVLLGVHGLTCVGREGTACTNVVLQSRVRIRRWYDVGSAVFLAGRLGFRTFRLDLLAGLRLLLFDLLFVSLFVPSSLWGRWLLAFSDRRVSSHPGERAVLVLPVLRFFVVFAVGEFFLLSPIRLSLLGSCFFGFELDFGDFLLGSVFGPFYGIFRVAECPPGGEFCGM